MGIGLLFDILTLIVLGFGIGFANGMTGIGAGALVLPALMYIVGLSPVNAVGTGLLYSILMRSYGVYQHFKRRTIRKRTAFYIILGGAPTVLVTSFVIAYLARTAGNRIDFTLEITISVVLLLTWVMIFINLFRGTKNYYVPPEHFPSQRKLYGIITGAGIGILIGATSVGGGVVIVPILVTIFRLSPRNAVGTSVLIGITMSAIGSFAYLLGGNVDILVATTMFVGCVPGVYLGARIAVKAPHRVLSAILFVVVTISVIVMFAGLGK